MFRGVQSHINTQIVNYDTKRMEDGKNFSRKKILAVFLKFLQMQKNGGDV